MSSRLATMTAGRPGLPQDRSRHPQSSSSDCLGDPHGEQSPCFGSGAASLVEVHGLLGLTRAQLEGHHEFGPMTIGTTCPNPFGKADVGGPGQHRLSAPTLQGQGGGAGCPPGPLGLLGGTAGGVEENPRPDDARREAAEPLALPDGLPPGPDDPSNQEA